MVAANDCLNSQRDKIIKSFFVCGISNNLDGSWNHLVWVPAELPTFKIPYGPDEDDLDPLQNLNSAFGEDSKEETDEESDSDSP